MKQIIAEQVDISQDVDPIRGCIESKFRNIIQYAASQSAKITDLEPYSEQELINNISDYNFVLDFDKYGNRLFGMMKKHKGSLVQLAQGQVIFFTPSIQKLIREVLNEKEFYRMHLGSEVLRMVRDYICVATGFSR